MLRIYLLLFKLYPCMFILCCMNKSGSHRCGSGDPSISEPIAIGIPKRKDSTLPLDHMQSPSMQLEQTRCGAHDLSWSPTLTWKYAKYTFSPGLTLSIHTFSKKSAHENTQETTFTL